MTRHRLTLSCSLRDCVAIGLAGMIGVLSSAAGAGADLPPPIQGNFGITPARRHVVGQPGSALDSTIVSNTTDASYRVTVFPVLLGQNLSGAFTFSTTPRALAAASYVLTASPNRFTLPAGGHAEVRLRWLGLPLGARQVPIGILFRGVALHQGTPVQVVTQLLSVNFLRLPGILAIHGRFTALQGQQAGPRMLRFLARVKNNGERPWSPAHGRFVVHDASGRIAYSTAWSGDVVIPGAERDYPIAVRKLLPAGHYTMTASMDFGAPEQISGAFTLVAPNTLPTPMISLRNFNAHGTIGSRAQATGQVVSSGTAPASVRFSLTLLPVSAVPSLAHAGAKATIAYTGLPAGTVRNLQLPIGVPLKAGTYRVIASWIDPTGAPQTAEAEFTAAVRHSFLDRLWRWLGDHLAVIAVFVALILLLLIAVLLRRQRRLRAELVAARAAAAADEHEPVGQA